MARANRVVWAGRVRRWRSSKLTAQEFAEREGLNAATLRWWASRLRRVAPVSPAFVEVVMPAAPVAGRIAVVVGEGVRIEVSGAFDAEVLRRVVAALEVR